MSIAAAGTAPPGRHRGEFSTAAFGLAIPACAAALTVHSKETGRWGLHRVPPSKRAAAGLEASRSGGRGVGRWTNGLAGLRRFCLFSLCRSSASLFPEPGVLGCAEVLRVGSRPPLGLGGEDQGLACKKQRHKSTSFLPFSGYLRDAQCG